MSRCCNQDWSGEWFVLAWKEVLPVSMSCKFELFVLIDVLAPHSLIRLLLLASPLRADS